MLSSLIKSFDNYKRVNLVAVLFLGVLVIGYPHFIASEVCSQYCSTDFKRGIIIPTFHIFIPLLFVGIALLLLPSRYFKRWLLYVVSWSVPLSILLLANTPIYGGFLSNRIYTAEMLSTILGGLFAISVLLFLLYDAWQWHKVSRGNGHVS